MSAYYSIQENPNKIVSWSIIEDPNNFYPQGYNGVVPYNDEHEETPTKLCPHCGKAIE